jgi:hypothetical protein
MASLLGRVLRAADPLGVTGPLGRVARLPRLLLRFLLGLLLVLLREGELPRRLLLLLGVLLSSLLGLGRRRLLAARRLLRMALRLRAGLRVRLLRVRLLRVAALLRVGRPRLLRMTAGLREVLRNTARLLRDRRQLHGDHDGNS